MRQRPASHPPAAHRTAPRVAAIAAVSVSLALTSCGDDRSASRATNDRATNNAEPSATTTGGVNTSSTSAVPTESAALDVVRAFAEHTVGMVEPVVGPFFAKPGDATAATVEVRTRRENGTEDRSLPATTVSLRARNGVWTIVSATGDDLSIDSPVANTIVPASAVAASGTASAFEGTVIVRALLAAPANMQRVGQTITTAKGTRNGRWDARIETAPTTSGAGYVLALTTSGTERGAPSFAIVPVMFQQPAGNAPLPNIPSVYAQRAVDAWLANDDGALGRYADAATAQTLRSHGASGSTWSAASCDGAAGSTYCTWTSATERLVLRVDNEAASLGKPEAVVEVRFQAR